ncbi:MAG: hypothetical protein R6X14_08995 [bacterium]
MRQVLVLLALAFAAASAGPAVITPEQPGICIYDMKWLDINNWLCVFHNDGRYGYDPTAGGGEAGGSWPQPFRNYYVFGAGFWFGGLKPRPGGGTDTLVSFGYNPNAGNTELSPYASRHRHDPPDSLDRVYAYPEDWPPPAERWPDVDTSLVPQVAKSDRDMWCVYSDVGEAEHIPPGYPLDFEVYQTVYAWAHRSVEDIFFLCWKVRNTGGDTLRDCYVGAVFDPDIGEHSDDMLGLLLADSVHLGGGEYVVVRDVGYAGDFDNHEVANPRGQWEEGTPGVVACKFLEGPRLDPARPRGPNNRLGLTSFKMFSIEVDPVTDPAQYLTMAGYDYRTLVYSPFDSIDLAPADKRFLMSSGPFDLAPGQVEVLALAVIAAPYGGWGQSWWDRRFRYNDSLHHLARLVLAAEEVHDRGWMIAVEEPGPTRPGPLARLPAVIRGSLFLPPGPGTRAVLLDPAGRKVLALAPGENDVSHLAPGVYFVRTVLWERSPDRDWVHKVVIQR